MFGFLSPTRSEETKNTKKSIAVGAPPTKEFLDSLSVVTEKQKKILIGLYENGQQHLFKEFTPTASPSIRRQLASQLEMLDREYVNGGLVGYIDNARKLLADSKNSVNPLEGWKPSVPVGETFEIGTDAWKDTERKGLKKLGSVGFVLVAGGLGERLGYSGIKVK
jgi:UDP-sugar pyrophosphorylase